MNKRDLVCIVADNAGLSKKNAEKAVSAVFQGITCSLKRREKVQLVGFGTFEVRERAARTGHNPKTKEPMQIPASKVPAFKAGKALKDTIKK